MLSPIATTASLWVSKWLLEYLSMASYNLNAGLEMLLQLIDQLEEGNAWWEILSQLLNQ
jgi:hypothetical protein